MWHGNWEFVLVLQGLGVLQILDPFNDRFKGNIGLCGDYVRIHGV